MQTISTKLGLTLILIAATIAVFAFWHNFQDNTALMPVVVQNSVIRNQNYSPNGGPVAGEQFAPAYTKNGISVLQPMPGATVSVPLNLLGYGLPAFEGVPGNAQILDSKGNVVIQKQLVVVNLGTATMSNGFFAVLNFSLPAGVGQNFTLRIHNDNPSGLKANDHVIDIPLKMSSAQ